MEDDFDFHFDFDPGDDDHIDFDFDDDDVNAYDDGGDDDRDEEGETRRGKDIYIYREIERKKQTTTNVIIAEQSNATLGAPRGGALCPSCHHL